MGTSTSPDTLEQRLEILRELLPSLEGSMLNDRTIYVWRRHRIDELTLGEIAGEQGWSIPAVHWHLRRADRTLGEYNPRWTTTS